MEAVLRANHKALSTGFVPAMERKEKDWESIENWFRNWFKSCLPFCLGLLIEKTNSDVWLLTDFKPSSLVGTIFTNGTWTWIIWTRGLPRSLSHHHHLQHTGQLEMWVEEAGEQGQELSEQTIQTFAHQHHPVKRGRQGESFIWEIFLRCSKKLRYVVPYYYKLIDWLEVGPIRMVHCCGSWSEADKFQLSVSFTCRLV